MKLSRTEANWIASKLLSDAERDAELEARRRTTWLVRLFPPLQNIPPTERISVLRDARGQAAREPWIVVPTIAAFIAGALLYFTVTNSHRHAWIYSIPAAVVVLNTLGQYLRTLSLLRIAVK